MNIAPTFPAAYAKTQLAISYELPSSGAVFISVADRDKRSIAAIARDFHHLGFTVLSTGGTANSGSMSGLYDQLVPWKAETPAEMARRADATCRYTLSLLAAGDARAFLYTAHGYQGLVSPPSYTVLVGADGYPLPALAAYAFFTRALEGRSFVGKADFGAAGCVYTFSRRDARPRVRLYTDLTADEADALNARTPLRDVYGNPYDRAAWFAGSLLYAFE